jgi:Zn finger protein HypA/HybF involved in hydrogenase expression
MVKLMIDSISECNVCSSKVEGNFHDFCELGCPVCGSHETVIWSIGE